MKQTISVKLQKGGKYYKVEKLENRIEPTAGSMLDKYELEAIVKEAAGSAGKLNVTVRA